MEACLRRKNYRAVRCSHSLRRICRQRCDLQYVWYRTLLLVRYGLQKFGADRGEAQSEGCQMTGNYPGRRSLHLVQSRIQGSSERHREGSRFPGESQAPIRCSQMQERGSIGASPQRMINPDRKWRGLKARLWKALIFRRPAYDREPASPAAPPGAG
jgi:hypothetical protein